MKRPEVQAAFTYVFGYPWPDTLSCAIEAVREDRAAIADALAIAVERVDPLEAVRDLLAELRGEKRDTLPAPAPVEVSHG